MTRTIAVRCMILFALLFQVGCASMFNGSKETISVDATSNQTEIYVNGRYVGEGQARATIPKKGNVTITARRSNCRPHSVQVERTFDPTTLLGLFIDGGIFSILVIDGAATGAWSKATQHHYRLTTRCEDEDDTSRETKERSANDAEPSRRSSSEKGPRSRRNEELRSRRESAPRPRRNDERNRTPSPRQRRLSALAQEQQKYIQAMKRQRSAPLAQRLGRNWSQVVRLFDRSFERELEALRAGKLKRRRRIRITREFTAWLLFEGMDRSGVASLLENSPIDTNDYAKMLEFAIRALKGHVESQKTIVEEVVTSETDVRMSAEEVANFESIAE